MDEFGFWFVIVFAFIVLLLAVPPFYLDDEPEDDSEVE